MHKKHAIKVSLFHHDTDRHSPIEIDDIMNTDVPATPLYMAYYTVQKDICQPGISVCKYADSISFQRICKRKFPVVAVLLLCLECLAFRKKSLLIHNQFVLFLLRYTYTVIRTCYRREVAYNQNVVTSCGGFSHKTKDASVAIVGIDPHKSRRIIVRTLKCRIFPVNMKKITDIFLKLFMAFFFS